LTIGQVAAQSGVPSSTIRYYEQIGLLPAPERAQGQRRYTNSIMQQLGVIRLAQKAGFTIAEIQQLLHGFRADAPPPLRWQRLASAKLAEVDEQIRTLQAMKRLLEQNLQCECGTLEECGTRGYEVAESYGVG
jgi:MerR family redox-sensitive transcriptional activator SoxR